MDKNIINLYLYLQGKKPKNIIETVRFIIKKFDLGKEKKENFYIFRDWWNENKSEYPESLLLFGSISFSNNIRFNSNGDFNNTFGSRFWGKAIEERLTHWLNRINQMNVTFTNTDFEQTFDYIKPNDFVYFDPPYLASNHEYSGWSESEETRLINYLDKLTDKGIKWCLSNTLTHKGKSNVILEDYIKKSGVQVFPIIVKYNTDRSKINEYSNNTSEILVKNF